MVTVSIRNSVLCQAQLKLQLQLQGELRLALFSNNPATQPPTHPATRSLSFSNISNDYWEPVLMCGVPPPLLAPC